jgi:hypothetical protein
MDDPEKVVDQHTNRDAKKRFGYPTMYQFKKRVSYIPLILLFVDLLGNQFADNFVEINPISLGLSAASIIVLYIATLLAFFYNRYDIGLFKNIKKILCFSSFVLCRQSNLDAC